jgi:hypothetical protein
VIRRDLTSLFEGCSLRFSRVHIGSIEHLSPPSLLSVVVASLPCGLSSSCLQTTSHYYTEISYQKIVKVLTFTPVLLMPVSKCKMSQRDP